MKKIAKSRKGLSTVQMDKDAVEILKKMGTKDESYSNIIKRMKNNPYNLDEGIMKQLNDVSSKWGIDHKTLITFGAVFVIFLASSGAIQQLQSIALKSNKPMLVVFMELLKRFRI
jgi:type II secretory pathway component PulL